MSELWRPVSSCTSGCLPRPDAVPRAGRALVAWRVTAIIAVLLAGGVSLLLLATLRLPIRRAVRLFARGLLAGLGIRHTANRRLPVRRALLVANHVSWVDVLVLVAHAPARVLAKREVRAWPVAGWLACITGTIFLDRRRPRRLPATVAEVRTALDAGGVVAVFPEGTTWCGLAHGRFRPALFQAAIDVGAPVVPVTLSFRMAGRPSTVAAYVGVDTLLASLGRILRTRGLTVSLRAHPSLHVEPSASRRALADAAGGRLHGTGWSLCDQHHHERAWTVDALDPRELDVAGGGRPTDERERPGRVESGQQLRHGLDDDLRRDHADVPIRDERDRTPSLTR